MTTIKAHFDGKVVVPDEPVDLPAGRPLRVSIELVEEPAKVTAANRVFRPLNIHIDTETSHAIALDPEFNIEES